MVKNRSVPTDLILPHIYYQNVAYALDWLTATFGFKEKYRFGDHERQLHGALLYLGNAWVMLKETGRGRSSPLQVGQVTQTLMVFVDDIDEHFQRTKLAGAKIVEDLKEHPYGERHYTAEDLEGHFWQFSKHVRDVSPDEWGATLSVD